MARRTVVDCDVNPEHQATTNLALALQGDAYELDVCADDEKRIKEAFAKLVKPGRLMPVRDLARRPSSNGNGQTTLPVGEGDQGAARVWLKAQGHNVADKGRVSEDLMQIWRAAGSPTA